MRTYVVVDPFVIHGWIREPMYDDAPQLGAHTQNAEFPARKYSLLDISDDGDVTMEDASYGVSMCGSVFHAVLTPDVIRAHCVEANDALAERVMKYQSLQEEFCEASTFEDDMRFRFNDALWELKRGISPVPNINAGWAALSGMIRGGFETERAKMRLKEAEQTLAQMLKAG